MKNIDLKKVDLRTIELNEDYPFTDYQVLVAILDYLQGVLYNNDFFIFKKGDEADKDLKDCYNMSREEYDKSLNNFLNITIDYLKKYKKDNMIKLIEKLRCSKEIEQVFMFLCTYNCLHDIEFDGVNFSKEDYEILNDWYFCKDKFPFLVEGRKVIFKNMTFNEENIKTLNRWASNNLLFENCIFDISYEQAIEMNKRSVDEDVNIFNDYRINKYGYNTKFKNCSFSNNSYMNKGIKRIINDKPSNLYESVINDKPFSCNTSIYIKLGDKCNGKCDFCKNESEIEMQTNIDKIIESLCRKQIAPHLNQIYFGGGEPSLYLDEIERIISQYNIKFNNQHYENLSTYMFTNGSGDWEKIKELVQKYYLYTIISRQEIEDKENKEIMGIDYSLEDRNIKDLIRSNRILFALTCNEQNMKEKFLQNYIQFGSEIGINNFIIQNLESKTNISISYLEEYLKEFEKYLESNHYSKSQIVSTSYFDLSLFKKDNKSIALKRYFNPDQLEEHLKFCPKHSFDLGIDSNGDIYNDFQMIKKLQI